MIYLMKVIPMELALARWLSWLERRPVTAEVVGSSPIRVVKETAASVAVSLGSDCIDCMCTTL